MLNLLQMSMQKLDSAEFNLLSRLFRQEMKPIGSRYAKRQSLLEIFGRGFPVAVCNKAVLDFGCGFGEDTVAIASYGARRAIGVDLRQEFLSHARFLAQKSGVADRCVFTDQASEQCDLIVSVDAFEHFSDPAAILSLWASLLTIDGSVCLSFGPTWLHPAGGHLFSPFPWAHLLLSEEALLRWRALSRSDGATTIEAAGLNRLTIKRFEQLVSDSPFRFASLELVPIRKLRFIHNRLTREFSTSVVRCRLVLK